MKFSRQKGVAAVELALVIVPLLILCFGITELGRALYQYDGVVKAARVAARYLTGKKLTGSSFSEADKKAASSLAVCGQLSCSSDPPLVAGLSSTDQVNVDPILNVETGAGSVSLVTVTIGGGNKPVTFTPVVFWVVRSSIEFSPIKVTMAFSTT